MLDWSDVDFETGMVHITKAWDRPRAEMKAPKTRAGVRHVLIEPNLGPLLQVMHDEAGGKGAHHHLDASGRSLGRDVSAASGMRGDHATGAVREQHHPQADYVSAARKLYELDQAWSKLPPAARLQNQKTMLAPFVVEFFAWVHARNASSTQERGLVSKALGYAIRQELAPVRTIGSRSGTSRASLRSARGLSPRDREARECLGGSPRARPPRAPISPDQTVQIEGPQRAPYAEINCRLNGGWLPLMPLAHALPDRAVAARAAAC